MRRIFALGEKEMEGEVALTALDSIQKENFLDGSRWRLMLIHLSIGK